MSLVLLIRNQRATIVLAGLIALLINVLLLACSVLGFASSVVGILWWPGSVLAQQFDLGIHDLMFWAVMFAVNLFLYTMLAFLALRVRH